MKLLYVIDSLAPGGAETSLAEMASGLVVRGIDLHVLPLGTRTDLAARLESVGAVVHRSEQSHGRLRNILKVRDVARRIRPDLIHTTLYEADIAGRVAASLLRLPVSTSIVSDSYSMSHYAESNTAKLHAARFVDAASARLANRFHANSAAIADSVSARLGIDRGKIDVIPRGRDPEVLPFRPPRVRETTRASLGIRPDQPVILSVGRLEPLKGFSYLIEALPSVAETYPGLVLLIAGKEGRSGQALRAQAGRMSVETRFLGHREDVPNLLAAADVFCLVSEREGFSGALVESLAAGCPIVTSRIKPNMEVLGMNPGTVGLLTPVGDTESIAHAIKYVLSDPIASLSRAARGRDRFEASLTIDAINARMAAFFYSVQQGRILGPEGTLDGSHGRK